MVFVMKKLAIISSYNESCGNASYTHVIKKALSAEFDVEVIPLDLFFIQKSGALFKKQADKHFKEIADRLQYFECVNIQFEAGLYGTNPADIFKHVEWLIDASKNVIVTMHRVDPLSVTLPRALGTWISSGSKREFDSLMNRRQYEQLYYKIIKKIKKASESKNAWVLVHTNRDKRIIKQMYDFKNCIDHPLSFLEPEERASVHKMVDRGDFLKKHGFDPGSKIVGVFGYIAAYKGVETAVAAMEYLPKEYQLAIFGSQHPQTIREFVDIDPFLSKVLNGVKRTEARGKTNSEWKNRVRFMGNLSDPDFIEALRLCDAVVLPYMEVGQSMSGVLVLALEAGARMIVSNNLAFFEAQKYFGEVFETFDIGNALELAQKVQFGQERYENQREVAFKSYNIGTLSTLMSSTYSLRATTERK